jgi:hypothetical protein
LITLLSDTAYHSFIGEVEALNTTTIRRLTPSCRHQILTIAPQEYAEDCQSLVEELRAQVEEETNRNLYTLTMFSVIFLPATLIASIWGMNVGGPVQRQPERFLAGRRTDSGDLHLVRDRPLPAQVQVLLQLGTVSAGAACCAGTQSSLTAPPSLITEAVPRP